MPASRLRRKTLWSFGRIAMVAAVVILLAGGAIAWRQQLQNRAADREVEARLQQAGPDGDPDMPATDKPSEDAFAKHTAAPSAPRYLFIPKLGVRAMVKPVGATADNRIEAPRNVFDIGWYTGSAKPGMPGAMVVDGHVSSWKTHGVLYDLKNIRSGDSISIERGDGQRIAYTVRKSQTYDADKVDMPAALRPINPDKPGLTIITCAGDVIKGTNDFDKRIVVFAEGAL